MINAFYEAMAIPDACQLGKRVFKKLFRENAALGVTDKKAFRDDIDTVVWQYTLKPSTIPIQAYEDDQREYLEVALLQVGLKTLRRTGRIAEVVHRAIPYPVVIVFAFGATCAISLAHKRFSQAEKEAIVVEDFLITDWIDLSGPTVVQKEFLASLAVAGLPHTHFFAFYSALVDRVVALDCARLTGEYLVLGAAERLDARRKRLAVCRDYEAQIAEHKAALVGEPHFNRKVELNTTIKELEQVLRQESALL